MAVRAEAVAIAADELMLAGAAQHKPTKLRTFELVARAHGLPTAA